MTWLELRAQADWNDAADATLIVAVAPLPGSVMVIVPAVPASMVSVADVALATVCAVIAAPAPVVPMVNVGVPGVPATQPVPTPVSVTALPVVDSVSDDGEADIVIVLALVDKPANGAAPNASPAKPPADATPAAAGVSDEPPNAAPANVDPPDAIS